MIPSSALSSHTVAKTVEFTFSIILDKQYRGYLKGISLFHADLICLTHTVPGEAAGSPVSMWVFKSCFQEPFHCWHLQPCYKGFCSSRYSSTAMLSETPAGHMALAAKEFCCLQSYTTSYMTN